jgi:xanthine dehydrogenase accessory factor
MNELERIVREAATLATHHASYLLATVVRVRGSAYRRPGARMLIAGDRWLAGCVSGGCLEGDVMLRGEHRCKDGPAIVTYDSTTEEDETIGVALGCHGVVDVLLEHVPAGGRHDALTFAAACFAAETPGALATVIASTHPAVPLGARVAIGPDCALDRTVTDPDARAALERAARGPTGVVELADLGITALVETVAPSPQLFVLGSGHDAGPIVTAATAIGFRVTVADRTIREPSRFLAAHRQVSTGGDLAAIARLIDAAAEAYVIVKHHRIPVDRAALAMALASRARYIGVLGPARRTRDMLAELGHGGDDPRLHAPIGLDLGAETPEQIALAVAAEIQAVRRRAPAGKLRDRARSLHADVAIAVLAAGASRRLGRPKQLVELDGAPLVRRVAAACIGAHAGPVAVIVGAGAEAVTAAVAGLPVAEVANPGWSEGIASSIRAAVRWAEATGAGALLIALADQPLISADHLAALRAAWLAGAPVVASRFADTVGAPAIFDRSRWSALLELAGDQGAGRLLRAEGVIALDCPAGAFDVDTDDDVRALTARVAGATA